MIDKITSNINSTNYIQGVEKTNKALDISESINTQISIKIDTFEISDESKLMNEISEYEKQLDDIFGIPKELNASELKKAEALEEEIDKILGLDNIQLSKSDQKLMDELDSQIDAIFESDEITLEQEKELDSLFARQDSILNNYMDIELSAEDEKKLDALFKEFDNLYGLKTPTDEQLIKADEIFSNLYDASNKLDFLNEKSNFFYENSVNIINKEQEISIDNLKNG